MMNKKRYAIIVLFVVMAVVITGCDRKTASVVKQKGDLMSQITEIFEAEHPAELFKELNDDLPGIFMLQGRSLWPINSRVQGISVTPFRDFTCDLWQAELK